MTATVIERPRAEVGTEDAVIPLSDADAAVVRYEAEWRVAAITISGSANDLEIAEGQCNLAQKILKIARERALPAAEIPLMLGIMRLCKGRQERTLAEAFHGEISIDLPDVTARLEDVQALISRLPGGNEPPYKGETAEAERRRRAQEAAAAVSA